MQHLPHHGLHATGDTVVTDTLDLDHLIPATIDAYTLVTPHTVRDMPPGVGRDAAEAWLEAVELDDAELLTEALLDLIGAGVIPNPRPGVCQGCLRDCPPGATYCAECAAYHGLAPEGNSVH